MILCDNSTVTIREEGIQNTISIDLVTVAPRTCASHENFDIASGTPWKFSYEAYSTNAYEAEEEVGLVNYTDSEATASDSPPVPVINAAEASPVKYTVKRIFRHVKVIGETHYVTWLRLQCRGRRKVTTLSRTLKLHRGVLEEVGIKNATKALIVGMVSEKILLFRTTITADLR